MKLGLLGGHKYFRMAVLSDLKKKISEWGWCLFEINFVSYHFKILTHLKMKTPCLLSILDSGTNVWKKMVGALLEEVQEEFSFKFLKFCTKKQEIIYYFFFCRRLNS